MSSHNYSKPKPTRGARISVKPVWRRKLDTCNKSSSIDDVVTIQPTPKPQTYPNETSLLPQQDHLTITLTNEIPHSPNSFLPNDPFEEHTQSTNNIHHSHSNMNPMLHVESTITNHNPTPSSSPSSEHKKFVEDIKEAHELNALLALHLTQSNLDQQPSSTNSSPSKNLIQLGNHVNNCLCCMFLQKQNMAINEHLTWIEYLLTKSSQTSSPIHHSSPILPPPNTPYPSPSNL